MGEGVSAAKQTTETQRHGDSYWDSLCRNLDVSSARALATCWATNAQRWFVDETAKVPTSGIKLMFQRTQRCGMEPDVLRVSVSLWFAFL